MTTKFRSHFEVLRIENVLQRENILNAVKLFFKLLNPIMRYLVWVIRINIFKLFVVGTLALPWLFKTPARWRHDSDWSEDAHQEFKWWKPRLLLGTNHRSQSQRSPSPSLRNYASSNGLLKERMEKQRGKFISRLYNFPGQSWHTCTIPA